VRNLKTQPIGLRKGGSSTAGEGRDWKKKILGRKYLRVRRNSKEPSCSQRVLKGGAVLALPEGRKRAVNLLDTHTGFLTDEIRAATPFRGEKKTEGGTPMAPTGGRAFGGRWEKKKGISCVGKTERGEAPSKTCKAAN